MASGYSVEQPAKEHEALHSVPPLDALIGHADDVVDRRVAILKSLRGQVSEKRFQDLQNLIRDIARLKETDTDARTQLEDEFGTFMSAIGVEVDSATQDTAPASARGEQESGAREERDASAPDHQRAQLGAERPVPAFGAGETGVSSQEAAKPAAEPAPETPETTDSIEALERKAAEVTSRVGYEGLMRSLSGDTASGYAEAYRAYRAAVARGDVRAAQDAYAALENAADVLLEENASEEVAPSRAERVPPTAADAAANEPRDTAQETPQEATEQPPVTKLDAGGNVVSSAPGGEQTAPARTDAGGTESGRWEHYKPADNEDAAPQTEQPQEAAPKATSETAPAEQPLSKDDIQKIGMSLPELSDLSPADRERVLSAFLAQLEESAAHDNQPEHAVRQAA